MANIPGVFIEFKGDLTQLNKDMKSARQMVTEQARGISDSLNNALSGSQIKASSNKLIENLGTLGRSSVVTSQAFKTLGVDLGQLQKLTGTSADQFKKLQEQILKTQTAAGQEKALRGIATAAGLSNKEITALGKQFGLTSAQIANVTGATTKASNSFSVLANSAKVALSTIGVAGGVAGTVALARTLVNIADQYTLIDSKLKLVSQSTEEFGATYKTLFDISQRTGSSFSTNAAAFSSLQLNMRDMNVSSAETLKMFEMLNKSLVVNGSNTVEASSFMLQFKQAMGSGKLAGDELRTMLEANSYFGTLLAKSLGVTTGALKTMGAEGKLTTDVLLRAFPQMSAQVDKDFGAIQKTISRAMMELRNAFEDVIADSNRTTGATSSVAESISDLARVVSENKEAISALFQGLITAGGFAVGMVADVTRSIQGLAIVAASSDKSLGDWATSNADDMKKWQAEIADGTAFIKDQIADLKDKRSDVALSFTFTPEARRAKEQELEAIDKEIAALNTQITVVETLNRLKSKPVPQDSFIVANTGQSFTPNTNYKDPFQVNRQWELDNAGKIDEIVFKREEDNRKKREQVAQEQLAIEQRVTDGIMQATKTRYEYSVWSLDQEVAKMREKAGADKELQAQITEYRKQQYQQLGEFGKMYDGDEQKRLNDMRDAFMRADEDLATIAQNRAEQQQDALQKMTAAIKSSKQSEIEAYRDAVDAELAELERLSDGSQDYEEKLSAYKEMKRRELNERLLREERRTLTEMQKLWQDFARDTKRDFTDIFAAGLKGEFDTIGDAWSALTKSMADRFLDLVATLTMNSLFDAIGIGGVSGGGATWGDALGWVVGAMSSSGNNAPSYAQGWEVPAYNSGGGGSSGGGGTAGGVVGSLVTSAVLGYVRDYMMTNVVTPIYNGLASTLTTTGTTAGATVGSSTGSTVGGSVATSSSSGSGAGAAAGMGGFAAAMYALPAAAFAFQTMNTKRRESYWNDAGVESSDFAGLGMDVSGAFYNIADATSEVKEGLNTLGVNFGEFAGLSIDAANGIAITGTAIRDAETNLIEGIDYQISYFDMAAGRWKETGTLFEQLLDQMSEMDPVTDEAINSVAQYVAEMAGVPSASDELAMAFVQMQTGIYDLAGAASSAAMIAAGAAASASAAAGMAHQYAAGSQEQYNYNVQQRQKDFSDYSVNFDDLGIEGHADGGIHGGGWRMVGERGPELEYTPPSRIFSNTDTNSILSEMRRGQGGDIGPVTVQIIGKGPGLEALIDKVIVTRERQGVTGRAFI